MTLSILLFFAGSLVGLREQQIRHEWGDKIDRSAKLLQQGDYKKALSIDENLIGEMEEMLGPGDAGAQIFGTVVTHKALAEAGLGNYDDALWYWHTALALFPRLAEADLSSFGEAGKYLTEHPPGLPKAIPAAVPGPVDKGVTPPRIRKQVAPVYPRGARSFGEGGTLVVEVVIDKNGRVGSPRVRQALPAATLSFAALEAVKEWRFEPGRLNGEPVEVLFNLTVNYRP